MALSIKNMMEVIKADIENKKSYPARFDSDCGVCSDLVSEGDTIYFWGKSLTMCGNCFNEIVEYLEEQVEN